MHKYIDADELKKVFRDTEDAEYAQWTLAGVIGEIDNIEAADVQEVVRCKDCKHTDLFYPYCTIWEAAIDGDGYCYKGEKE